MNYHYHPYHLVNYSPWPLLISFTLLLVLINFMMYLNISFSIYYLLVSLFLLILILFYWFNNIIIEGTYIGDHTTKVQSGITIGFYLFLFSEVLIFLSLFATLFYNIYDPSYAIGGIWPPIGIHKLNTWSIPLFNTLLLLLSSFFITWSHHSIITKDSFNTILAIFLTILCGSIFLYFLFVEYSSSSFTIADSIFGSIFFFLTGLHGSHVLIGTIFLFICLIRLLFSHFSSSHSIAFDFSVIYWHFVDIVWLFVFIFLYVI